MDRCALFVDAGYLLADGAMAVHGTRHREAVSWDYPGLLQFLTTLSRERTGLPLLRCYWYEATVEGRRTPEHDVLADIPGLKLRLGRIRPGRREGVDAQVHRDLMTLARNNAVCDAVVVSGDEDLTQVVSDAQDLGIRVTVMQIATDGAWSAARTLRQECDDLIEIGSGHLRSFVSMITGADPGPGNGLVPYGNGTLSNGTHLNGSQHNGTLQNGTPHNGTPSQGSYAAGQHNGAVTGAHDTPPQGMSASGTVSNATQPHPSGTHSGTHSDTHQGTSGTGSHSAGSHGLGSHGLGSHGGAAHGTGSQGTGSQGTGSQGAGSPGVGSQGSSSQGSSFQGAGYQSEGSHRTDPQSTGADSTGPQTTGPQTTGAQSARAHAGGSEAAGSYGTGSHSAGSHGTGAHGSQGSGTQGTGTQGTGTQGTGIQGTGIQGTGAHSGGRSSAAHARPALPAQPSPPAYNGYAPESQQPAPPRQAQPPVSAPLSAPPPAIPPAPPTGAQPPSAQTGQAHTSQAHTGQAQTSQAQGQQQYGSGPTGYAPSQLGPYTGPQPAPVPMQTGGTTTLAEAVKAAHKEGHDFGESVARDAPALWLEAVLARKPRMPSDLEARLLQGSSLPIDFLLHDEVRQALRRGFWDALERARR